LADKKKQIDSPTNIPAVVPPTVESTEKAESDDTSAAGNAATADGSDNADSKAARERFLAALGEKEKGGKKIDFKKTISGVKFEDAGITSEQAKALKSASSVNSFKQKVSEAKLDKSAEIKV